MKLGSLCSGAGGLDMAVEAMFGAKPFWHCEKDTAASKVLAARYPGVPNHGDLINTDWSTVEPVDIMCAGWPCQPFSAAGQSKGADDERAIWPDIARAIRVVRPRIVVLENVTDVFRHREFDRVAADLATLGYDLRWTCLRASDVGSCHKRERLFIVARLADTEGDGWSRVDDRTSGSAARRGREWNTPRSARDATADSARNGWQQGWSESARIVGGSNAAECGSSDGLVLLPTPSAADGGGGHLTQSGDRSDEMLLPGIARAYEIGALLPTPNASDGTGGGQHPDKRQGHSQQLIDHVLAPERWGKYAAGIQRWERLFRAAPSPTEPNTKGNPRLNPQFSEWMMGWPAGWVTDFIHNGRKVPDDKISRNDALRIIGNGVVPQQATAAMQWLLSLEAAA